MEYKNDLYRSLSMDQERRSFLHFLLSLLGAAFTNFVKARPKPQRVEPAAPVHGTPREQPAKPRDYKNCVIISGGLLHWRNGFGMVGHSQFTEMRIDYTASRRDVLVFVSVDSAAFAEEFKRALGSTLPLWFQLSHRPGAFPYMTMSSINPVASVGEKYLFRAWLDQPLYEALSC